MELENKWSWKRFSMLLLMMAATVVMTVITLWKTSEITGSWLLIVFCGVIFNILLSLNLEWDRKEKGLLDEKSNNYGRITVTYVICCVIVVIIRFLPAYARPVMLVSAWMTMTASPFTGIIAGSYSAILLAFASEGSLTLAVCYFILSISGCVLARFMQEKKNLFWGGFMIVCITFCVTIICAVLEKHGFSLTELMYGIINGLISGAGVALIFHLWNDKIVHSREASLVKILDEQYTLVQAMLNYSRADYEHARKVSRIAGGCAAAVGADKELAKAAGFYYRVGRLEGEPFVENGIEVAKKHHFPPELIQILSEYNGEKHLPSTVESALVHIVDHVVAKFDVLDRTTLSSSWNQDIVVYQTLNENSASGLYDKSGLGMNMFLIIRDYLIKEAGLYDNHS